ncbi:MAG: hypothetical protein IKE66_05825 [Hyphomicrobium sp.]|nr:hypothetical protein [Hyphomicrobium sp.]
MQTIVCMKWGKRYPADFANRLHSMIKRNTARPTRLVCYTDDMSGLDPAIEGRVLPPIVIPERITYKPWRKVSLWAPTLPGLEGDVLFMDLDLVVTGSLDSFFDYEPSKTFCVIENWTQMGSGIGNTSVYRFRVGAHPYLYDNLQSDADAILARFPNSQTYISKNIKEKTFWPAEWCESFKHTLMPRWPLNFFQTTPLPAATKVVAFTGKPDPDEARDGHWEAPWYKKTYKHVRPTPWIAQHWR